MSLVDDAAPEGLEEVARRFDDPRIRYFRNAWNIGGRDLSAAWNAAMGKARGRFAVLASDDDEYRPEYLAEMMSLVERFPAAGVYHCRVEYIDAEGCVHGENELRAAAEFRPWVHDLIRSFQAASPGDAAILARTNKEIDGAIDHLAMWVFRNARPADAVRALWRLDLGPRLRLAYGMSVAALRRLVEIAVAAWR